MRAIFGFIQRYALSVALLLVTASMLLSTYTVLKAVSTAAQVAAERSASILRACTSQNVRHTDTVRQLDVLLAKAEAHAGRRQRAQLKESRAATVLLINALAPYQNCQRVLARSTSKNGNVNG